MQLQKKFTGFVELIGFLEFIGLVELITGSGLLVTLGTRYWVLGTRLKTSMGVPF